MQTKYITIKEVANRAGVSVQSVYKRLSTDFQPYLIVENGKKYLDIAVLEKYETVKHTTELSTDFQQLLNLVEKQNQQLQVELDIKNKQIEQLNARLAELTETLQASQALHAGTIQKQLTAGADEAPKKKKKWWSFSREK